MKKLAPPLDEKALDRLERCSKHRDVAALIMEPIVMNLNVLVPDSDFMRELVPVSSLRHARDRRRGRVWHGPDRQVLRERAL